MVPKDLVDLNSLGLSSEMLRINISEDCESRRQLANPGLPGK